MFHTRSRSNPQLHMQFQPYSSLGLDGMHCNLRIFQREKKEAKTHWPVQTWVNIKVNSIRTNQYSSFPCTVKQMQKEAGKAGENAWAAEDDKQDDRKRRGWRWRDEEGQGKGSKGGEAEVSQDDPKPLCCSFPVVVFFFKNPSLEN